MSSTVRRAFSDWLRLRARAAVPSTEAGVVQLYSRQFAAAQLEALRGNGVNVGLSGFLREQLPRGYVYGAFLEQTGNTSLRLQPFHCRSDDDTFDCNRSTAVNLSSLVTGINGLDVGVRAANTWYAVWVVDDSTHVNNGGGLLSTSFSNPVLPAGYDVKRRVGVARTDGSSNFAVFRQVWGGTTGTQGQRLRRYFWDETITLALTNGQATAFTAVDLSARVPPGCKKAHLDVRFAAGTLGAVTDEAQLRPPGSVVADGPAVLRRGTGLSNTQMITNFVSVLIANQQIEYKVVQGGANQNICSVRVLGFDDEI